MFFTRLKQLCDERGISVYKACTDIGLNRSAVAKWKAGGQPNGTTAAKLAQFLGVTTDYLLGRETPRERASDEDIKFALFGGDGEITDEMYDEVKKFAAFIKQPGGGPEAVKEDTMELGKLYELAAQENIPVLAFPLAKTGSMSVMQDSGECCIGMDASIRDGGTRERVHLSHELGHCMTGSFYNRYAAVDSRRRHENRADKWAIQQLIPVEALDDAVAEGCIEPWELAERFGVSEEFVKKAVSLYVHGNVAAELYF